MIDDRGACKEVAAATHALRSLCLWLLLLMTGTSCVSNADGVESQREVGHEFGYGVPSNRSDASVSEVGRLSTYLSARIETQDYTVRFLFPAGPDCEASLGRAEGAFVLGARFGRYESGGGTCDAVGTLSLGAWRDARRKRARYPLRQHAHARYRSVGRDGDMLMLRGRFPLAAILGVGGGYDLEVFLPDREPCTRFAEETMLIHEFRRRGPDALVLGEGEEVCPILGFALPPR